MSPLALVFPLGVLTACASECDEARDHLDSCRDEINEALRLRGSTSMPITIADGCSNANECVSKCVNEAECAALAFVIAEPPADPNRMVPAGASTLSECVTDCAERSPR